MGFGTAIVRPEVLMARRLRYSFAQRNSRIIRCLGLWRSVRGRWEHPLPDHDRCSSLKGHHFSASAFTSAPGAFGVHCWQSVKAKFVKPTCSRSVVKRTWRWRARFDTHDPMYGPAVRRKRFSSICWLCGLASMYPASRWSVFCSGPPWISARVRSS